MIVYLILSVFFSIIFASAAKRKRVNESVVWIFPLALGSVIFAGTIVMEVAVLWFLSGEESPLTGVLSIVITLLGLGLFFGIIARQWKRLRILPDVDPS